ncbi:MAG: HigA family addiction module antitoxin [Woeseiaceae bacterium]
MAMHNPPHPGEFIRATYIEPFGVSIRSLAENLGVSASTLARVVAERSAVSPEMALRLSKALGRSPESWLAMQDDYDLWQAKEIYKPLEGAQSSVRGERLIFSLRASESLGIPVLSLLCSARPE